MIIVKITGGLGNQMFQYAFARALQHRGHEVRLDISAYKTYRLHGGYKLDQYKIELGVVPYSTFGKSRAPGVLARIKKRLRINDKKTIRERSLLFDRHLLSPLDDCVMEGYFQSEKYFSDIKAILYKSFVTKTPLSEYTAKIGILIDSKPQTCSIHIRRGDYLDDVNARIHGSCVPGYYQAAMRRIDMLSKDMYYFIFSDDIEWARENVRPENAFYVDSREARLAHEDIYLMSICGHNIIANSSFSWWGAWLNKHLTKIVISPKRWFNDEKLERQSKDIVPDDWIRL